MFQKKQKIYSETQGVCIVENIVQLPAGKGETLPYYVLKSVLDEKTSYIPVNNHQVSLRELFTEEEARELLKTATGVEVVDDIDNFVYPTPKDAAGKNPVYVGRIRNSIAFDNGLEFFCVADNLRIGAALNTVRIAEKVIEMGLY